MSRDSDLPNQPHRRRRAPRRRGPDSSASAGKPPVQRVFDALREEHDGGVSPDVADAVMARLGFERTTRRGERRERVRTLLGRVARSAVVLAVVGGSLWLIHSTRIERHRGSSVEEVVRASLARQGELLGNVANGVRPLDRLLNVDETFPAETPPSNRRNRTLFDGAFDGAFPGDPDAIRDGVGDEQMPAVAPHKRA